MIDYHRNLLADEVRVRAYREAIARVVRPGDVVIDLGCGSGILSFFACEAGASRVYAIERSHMADVTALLARHLGVAERVTVLHEESAQVQLPERADVLVTETMGPFGFDENILGHVRDARTRLLRDGATIVPQRLALALVPVSLPDEYAKRIGGWNDPQYGLDLSPVQVLASNARYFAQIDDAAHLATAATLCDVELAAFDAPHIRGHATFTVDRDAIVHGFGAWFAAVLAEGIVLTNRTARATHWKQGFFPIERPVAVARGAPIDIDLETDDGKSWRWRSNVAGTAFDQTTWFSMPPCTRPHERES